MIEVGNMFLFDGPTACVVIKDALHIPVKHISVT